MKVETMKLLAEHLYKTNKCYSIDLLFRVAREAVVDSSESTPDSRQRFSPTWPFRLNTIFNSSTLPSVI